MKLDQAKLNYMGKFIENSMVEAASRDLLVSLGDIGGWHEHNKEYYIPTLWRLDP